MSEKNELVKAEQQLIGFVHAVKGYSVISLVEEMGLTLDEWCKLDVSFLPKQYLEEVTQYFRDAV